MNGFTLMETIIAVFLLTVGIVGLLYMFPAGLQTGKSAQMTSLATQLGQAKIEEIISENYDDPVLQEGITTEDYGAISGFESFKRVTTVNCVEPNNLTEVACDYDVINDPDPMKKAEIKVFWKSPLGPSERNIKISNLTAKR